MVGNELVPGEEDQKRNIIMIIARKNQLFTHTNNICYTDIDSTVRYTARMREHTGREAPGHKEHKSMAANGDRSSSPISCQVSKTFLPLPHPYFAANHNLDDVPRCHSSPA